MKGLTSTVTVSEKGKVTAHKNHNNEYSENSVELKDIKSDADCYMHSFD